MKNPWITIPRPNPNTKVRLFCFPYSGASASMYYPWIDVLPTAIEICPVQLPGRGSRVSEKPISNLTDLVDQIYINIIPYIDKPFALFGHSMGALVSFELARKLKQYGKEPPIYLFVSGHNAPHLPDTYDHIHQLPESEFIENVRMMNGTPDEVLKDPELRDLIIPILRADFTICETYKHMSSDPLDCPICACGGLNDKYIDRDGMKAWQNHTNDKVTVRLFPGDHFYLNNDRIYLLQTIAQEINQIIDLR